MDGLIKKQILACCTLLLGSVLFPSAAETQLEFSGEIVATTCEIETNSKEQSYVLGEFQTNEFPSVGSEVGQQAFTIKLDHCWSMNSAEVTFKAEPDSNNSDYFKLQKTDGGKAATGVALKIIDQSGSIIYKPNTATSTPLTGKEKEELKFYASYIKTVSAIEPGSANVYADFVINYK